MYGSGASPTKSPLDRWEEYLPVAISNSHPDRLAPARPMSRNSRSASLVVCVVSLKRLANYVISRITSGTEYPRYAWIIRP
jgi:hypothetical protein